MKIDHPIECEIAEAIILGETTKALELLEKHPEFLHGSKGGRPWIMFATCYNNLTLMKYLLDHDCDVNEPEDYSSRFTALDEAIIKNNLDFIKFLLDRGANPNTGRQVITAITGNKKSLEMVKLLDQYGLDLQKEFVNELTKTKEPMNALSTAMAWGKQDVVDYLLSRGCVLPGGKKADANEPSPSDEVVNYFSQHFGPVQKQALIEIVPTSLPAIAVHVIPSTRERKVVTLFTTGLSTEPMTVPDGMADFQFAELFIELPGNWKYKNLEDPKWGWPIHWLRSTAQYPHQHKTWLGGPVTIIANEDPPQPLAPNLKFTSMLLVAEQSFTRKDGKTVQLYRLTPLYTEERDLEIRKGIPALMQAFDKHDIPFVVNLKRKNVGI